MCTLLLSVSLCSLSSFNSLHRSFLSCTKDMVLCDANNNDDGARNDPLCSIAGADSTAMPAVRSRTTNGGIYASFFAAEMKDPFTADTSDQGILKRSARASTTSDFTTRTNEYAAGDGSSANTNVSAYTHSHGGAFYATPRFDGAGRTKLAGSQQWMEGKPGDNYLILTNVIGRQTEHWAYVDERRDD